MSVFIPVVEQHRHARGKPDLRLAESYIPALVLYIKCLGYTTIAPIILLMQWKLTVLCVTAFALLLYVDHLYLSHGMAFIDTTALCLDVFGSTLLMLAISLLRPCSQQCQAILALWTLLGAAYLLLGSTYVPRPLAHACAFILALFFIYADSSTSSSSSVTSTNPLPLITMLNQTAASSGSAAAPTTTLHVSFISRTMLYVTLALVDIYLFRPLFQQENERLLFCKYAPVLLGSWPWYLCFGFMLGTAQLAKHWHVLDKSSSSSTSSSIGGGHYNTNNNHHHHHHHHHHNTDISSSSSSSMTPASASCTSQSIQDLDIMEAFRLAKEQHMGGKFAN